MKIYKLAGILLILNSCNNHNDNLFHSVNSDSLFIDSMKWYTYALNYELGNCVINGFDSNSFVSQDIVIDKYLEDYPRTVLFRYKDESTKFRSICPLVNDSLLYHLENSNRIFTNYLIRYKGDLSDWLRRECVKRQIR